MYPYFLVVTTLLYNSKCSSVRLSGCKKRYLWIKCKYISCFSRWIHYTIDLVRRSGIPSTKDMMYLLSFIIFHDFISLHSLQAYILRNISNCFATIGCICLICKLFWKAWLLNNWDRDMFKNPSVRRIIKI